MSLEALQVVKVYRDLLKAVKQHIQSKHFHEYLVQEFRVNSGVSVQHRINLARDYTFLLNSVHHHKNLLYSYNIAVDRSEEMKRVLGKSAASVGLQLPEVYQP